MTAASGRRLCIPAVLATLLLALVTACGGDGGGADKKPASQPVEGGTTLAALWPLTGEPATGATPKHPVLVVKIDNTDNSEPQLGLRKADLVTEELVEGGITRLAVFFYQQLPAVVGPVRSMRASDIGVVKPTHGVLVASGAAPPTLGRLNDAKVKYFTEGGPGYYRDSARTAPYNLMVRLAQLAGTLDKGVVPASYLPWGSEKAYAGTVKATGFDAKFSPSHSTDWQYSGDSTSSGSSGSGAGKYDNTNSHADQGQRFRPDTVLVLRVREGDAGYLDPAGHSVPETLYSGSGALMMFHHGTVVRGTWSKARRGAPLRLKAAGKALTVPAGHTWIELVPRDTQGGSVVVTP